MVAGGLLAVAIVMSGMAALSFGNAILPDFSEIQTLTMDGIRRRRWAGIARAGALMVAASISFALFAAAVA